MTFLPNPTIFPAQAGVLGYDDITPRFGMAYDLFGNGKTSLKVNAGKYLEAATNHNTYSASNPTARMVGSSSQLTAPPPVTRTWTDGNGNFVPDCDFLNPAQQDNRARGRLRAAQQQLASRSSPTVRPGILRAGASVRATGRSACRFNRSYGRASLSRSATSADGSRISAA